MSDVSFNNRQNFEMESWPELRQKWNEMIQLVFPEREVSGELKQLVFTIASLSSGCRHCQSHGAYHLHKIGVSDEKIQAIWSFETSDLFTDAERAAMRLGMAAGTSPNVTEPENFEEMRQNFSDIQIVEILAVISVGGFLNRWNDTIATVTDQESIDFADQVLRPVGWEPGKHVGAEDEQRKAHPITLGWSKK